MQILRGIAVSPGVAVGPLLVVDPRGRSLPPRALGEGDSAVADELDRLDRALDHARSGALAAEADARRRLGPQYADILAAHARLIADPGLRRESRAKIEAERLAAEHAVCEVLDGYAALLERLADAHLAARAADVRDIEDRILDGLLGGRPAVGSILDAPAVPSVALARDLAPSEAARLDPTRILGFATEAGGPTGHTAIVAAALEIPAVVGLGPLPPAARRCRTAIIDGDDGLVVLDPDPATLLKYHEAAGRRAARAAGLDALADLPAVTRDGHRVGLLGNIEFPAEADACRRQGADGVGLFRTEFLYLNAEHPPTEDEQAAAYGAVVASLQGRPVTIRTLDLGADKLPAGWAGPGVAAGTGPEPNPALGLRSLRLSLRDVATFRTQLRAVARAAAIAPPGAVRLMFPLVATLSELRRARALVGEVLTAMADAGEPVPASLPIGAMIEVPAAAIMADQLAEAADFFSIGTNDLIQYALAADRTNQAVAGMYTAADPAILRLLAGVVAAAAPRGLEVTVCGSMAAEPLYAPLLVGLGVRHLSMPPHQLPEVKRIVRALRLDDARALAAEALGLDTGEAVAARLRAELDRLAPAG